MITPLNGKGSIPIGTNVDFDLIPRETIAFAIPQTPNICGPDITHDLVGKLAEYGPRFAGLRGTFPKGVLDLLSKKGQAALSYAGLVLRPGGPFEYKGAATSGCPKPDCLNTVRLCDRCIPNDVPGNIAFAYLLELADVSPETADKISDVVNRVGTGGKPDPARDKAQLRAGRRAARRVKRSPIMKADSGSTSEDQRDEIQRQICASLAKWIELGGIEENSSCLHCPEKYGG